MTTKRIYINSEFDRDTQTQSRTDFSVFLQENIHMNRKTKMVGLSKAIIPNTLYPFHSGNNKLYFYTSSGQTTAQSVAMDVTKNYNSITEVANELSSLFSSYNIAFNVSPNGDRLEVKNNRASGSYFEFVEGTDGAGNSLNEDVYPRIGMVTSTDFAVITPGNTHELTGIPRLGGTLCFNVSSRTLVDQVKSITPKKHTNHNILCSIPNNAQFGNFLIYEPDANSIIKHRVTQDFTEMDFQILDDNFRVVDLNGSNIWLELEVDFV